jgi:segregation and condensation protein A
VAPAIVPETGLSGDTPGEGSGGFRVHLAVFEGPFDLLLGLIAKHKLDVTEVALSRVTDEFIAYLRARDPGWDLGQATEFLVVAATLLDLKAARLLPAAEVEDEDDLALLEARDLLFARLLQYRAYKDVAAVLADQMAAESLRVPRSVSLEPALAGLLPEVLLGLGPEQLARLAAAALTPRPAPVLELGHLHAPVVSVREQVALLRGRLQRSGAATFRVLTADCQGAGATSTIVARFLAVLDLFRDGMVSFEQVAAMGELTIRWAGPEPVDGEEEQ